MDMIPPQPPPAFVSSVHQPTIDALHRMADIQRWIVSQHDALPMPSEHDQDREAFLVELDAFWSAPSIRAAGEEPHSRKDALQKRLVAVARDNASLLIAAGGFTDGERDLASLATGSDDLPAYVQASELLIDELPHPGSFVLQDKRAGGATLLFSTQSGWEGFDSIDELLASVGSRLDITADENEGDGLGIYPIEGLLFASLTDGLVQWHRQAVADAWDTSFDDERVDALHDALDLHALVDVDAMVIGDASDRHPHRSRRSPPGTLAGAFRQAGRGGMARGGTAMPGVSRTSPGAMVRAGGSRLPAGLAHLRSVLRPADTLFPESALARDIVLPQGTQPVDGVFHLNGAAYVRQADRLYKVRFDASRQSWRLSRNDALDARFSGAQIERRPDGQWRYRRKTGLQGGFDRAAPSGAPVPSGWADYQALDLGQAVTLRQELILRLGHRQGTTVLRDMTRQPLPGSGGPTMTPAQYAAWREALAIARGMTRHASWAAYHALGPAQRDVLRDGLTRRLGPSESDAVIRRASAHPSLGAGEPQFTTLQRTAWADALSEARAHVSLPAPVAASTSPPRLTAAIADFSPRELSLLRERLRRRLGFRADAVHNELALGVPAEATITADELRMWNAAREGLIAKRSGASTTRPGTSRAWLPRPRSTISVELSDFTEGELKMLRNRLATEQGETTGKRIYDAMAKDPFNPAKKVVVSAEQRDIWDRAVEAIRHGRQPPHMPTGRIPADLADFSAEEFRTLRTRLRRRLGYSEGGATFQSVFTRNPDAPDAVLTGQRATVWGEIVDDIRLRRRTLPSISTPQAQLVSRTWRVPESEWPDVVYHYARPADLILRADGALALPQMRVTHDGVLGIPLSTATPDTPLGQVSSATSTWLSRSYVPQHGTLGEARSGWVRIDLRRALHRSDGAPADFELYRLGAPGETMFVLRPTAASAQAGHASSPSWLLGTFTLPPIR